MIAGRAILARVLEWSGRPLRAASVYLGILSRRPCRTKFIRRFLAAVDQVPDEAERAKLIEGMLARRKPGTRRNPLPGRVIVSVTSYPRRYPVLAHTLRCLLAQNLPADQVVLWIAHQDAPALPPEVLTLQSQGLQIRHCDDLRSYKKILPMLAQEPDAFIVTADDDVCYAPDWLERLALQALRNPGCVIAHRARLISLDAEGLPRPYAQWRMARRWDWLRGRWRNSTRDAAAPELVFPTGVGGVLYPPGALQVEPHCLQRILSLAPHADDIGLFWIWRANGLHARLVEGERFNVAAWPGSQAQALMEKNVDAGGNDAQIHQLVAHFGAGVLRAGTGRSSARHAGCGQANAGC